MTTERSKVDGLPKWRFQRVVQYINANIGGPLKLANLAAVAGLSPTYFAAQFRAATGRRPHDYVVSCRIERAKDLLANSDLALAEIALTVGFGSQPHFTDVFKRITGKTPAKWRLEQNEGARAYPRQAPTREINHIFRPVAPLILVDHLPNISRLRSAATETFAIRSDQIYPDVCSADDVGRVLKFVDEELSDGRPWVTARGPTVADIGLYFFLLRAQARDAARFASYPNIRNWLRQASSLFSESFEAERPMTR
jgi:AraC-like DNA-binding protein